MYRSMRPWIVLTSLSAVWLAFGAVRADQRPDRSDARDQVAAGLAEKWVVSGGSTTLHFDPHVLADLGLYVEGLDHGSAHHHDDADSIILPIDPASHLTFSVVDGSLKRIAHGEIVHFGVLPLGLDGSEFNLEELMLAPADDDPISTAWSLDPARNGALGGLVMDRAKAGFDPATRSLTIHSPELRLSRELADFMGDAGLADVTIGSVTVHARAKWVGGAEPEGGDFAPGDDPLPLGGASGPDMTFCQLYGLNQRGRSGDIVGLSEGTTSWNVGDEDLMWFNIPDEEHPYIVMNLYRLMDDRFEQIGQSHIKHGFYALGNHQCGGPPCSYEPGHSQGDWLGTGCTDTYSPYLNGQQGGMGPRFSVNPWTGYWYYPGSHMQGSHSHDGEIDHRLQVRDRDLNEPDNPGATYYAEGYYVVVDDVDVMNSAAWKPITINGGSPGAEWFFGMSPSSTMPVNGFAIDAWAGAQQAILAQELPVIEFVSPDGRCKLATKASDLGGGQWHYEYALLNIDMDRQVGSLSIPIPAGAFVTNTDFHAVEHHGETVNTADPDAVAIDNAPWHAEVFEDAIVWSTETNPLRWGTLYNFRFDADVPPAATTATLGMFRSGAPNTVSGSTMGPDLDADFDTIVPDTMTIVRGLQIDGDLEDLFVSDNSYLVVQPAALVPQPGPPVQVEVESTSPVDNPSELRFRYEGHATVTPVEQVILLFNYDTQEYDVVDMRIAATSDEVVTIVISDDPGRYIEAGTGRMKALMTFISTSLVEYLLAVAEFDQAIWLISP